ncbi:MAG: ribosomal protein S18-alanine N-acetyltransferase [Candidatus Asgardarchaeia archaeon]
MLKISKLVIEPIRMQDVSYIIEINRVCLPENYPRSYFEYLVNTWTDACLLARVEDKVVGYVLSRIESGFSSFSIRWVKKGHIVSIAVLPAYRNRGIGTNLLLRCIKALKEKYKVNEIILEVRVTNPAQRLYERLGFVKVKVLRGYYSDGEDAYLMALKTNN